MSIVLPDRPTKRTPPGGDRRFELLVHSVHDYGIYLLDSEGYVSSWNPGAERFKGYTAEEILGHHFSRFYPPEDRAAGLPQKALQAAAAEGRFEAEGWRVRKDGSRFWASVVIDPVRDEDGQLLGFAKITRDITEKRATERALFESEERFRMLVEGVRDYAIYMLDGEGRITNWNAGAEAIKGYREEEVLGRHFSLFYTPEDRAAGEPESALATAVREGRYEAESWRVRKDGSRFWASVLLSPIRTDDGRLVGFAKVTRDVTERRRAEQEIETAREALNQAQKMEAVGRLTGGVAHDFNNLLTVIRSSIDLMRRPDVDEQKRQRYLDAIAETADRAALLTRQLLTFARRQPLRPELFDVAERIRGLEQIIATSVGSPVQVECDVPDSVGTVEADPNQFETAVLNIVINARDAMDEGGRLQILARQVPALPGAEAEPVSPGYAAVTIADDGCGMDTETLARIFEPFFTTKAPNKGTGLGLSQVFGFVKQSGGEIDVDSTVGSGTRFTLYLPCAESAAPEPAAAPVEAIGSPEAESLRVLLVEDHEQVAELAQGLLGELGQTVTWARDAGEALALLERRRQDFDIVFSDVVMPGMSGVELAQLIRQRWPELPVVLTSGYSEILVQEGSHGFRLLQKPYSMQALRDALDGRPENSGAARSPTRP